MSIFIDLKTDKLVNEILQNSIQFYPTSLDMCILLHMYIGIYTNICIERDFWELVHQNVNNGNLWG